MTGTDTVSESESQPSSAGSEGSQAESSIEDRPTRRRVLSNPKFAPIVLATTMTVALVAAGTAYATVYRNDKASSDEANQEIVTSANDGAVAILSYSPTELEADFTKAKTHLTGEFLTYYEEFTTKVVKPAATDNGVDTTAQVVRSAVSKHEDDTAEVLAFVNQTTTSTPKPEPELSSSTVRITLDRVDGRWLISSFDPV
ncbi:hypothetical protein [Rhodococcus sp. NPDC058521]|uniref:hypothetical protein n=1 Tax=Rhodococcus sp. NPDC058521 TaxID=3346536 RepID=UPI00365F3C4C